jgi:hypothetical protein
VLKNGGHTPCIILLLHVHFFLSECNIKFKDLLHEMCVSKDVPKLGPATPEAGVRSQTIPCLMCCKQSGTVICLSPSTLVSTSQYYFSVLHTHLELSTKLITKGSERNLVAFKTKSNSLSDFAIIGKVSCFKVLKSIEKYSLLLFRKFSNVW